MLQFGDWVKIQYGEYQGNCGKIASRKKSGEYRVILYGKSAARMQQRPALDFFPEQPGEMIELREEALTLLEPYVLSQKDLRKVARAELVYSDFANFVYPPFNIKAARRYTLKVEDLKAALMKINQNKPPLAQFKQWFWLILNVFYDSLNIEERYDPEIFSDFPKDEKEIFSTVYGLTEKLYWKLEERFGTKEENEQFLIQFQDEPVWDAPDKEQDELEISAYYAVCSEIIGRIDSYLYNKDKSQGKWLYSPSQMKHVIGAYESDKDLKGATPEALALYRDFVRRLYREGDLQAIRILAFGYYEGGIAYRQNRVLAKHYLQELFDKTGDAYAAVALGEIYYHGYANHGEPDYEKAFRCFSYGVLDGIDEAVYRSADMIMHGQGTVRNIDMGLNLLVDGYRNSLDEFCREIFDGRFAEFAMYMGEACMEGIIYGMGTKDAYRFFLEADFALQKRASFGFADDRSVRERLDRSLEAIREQAGLDPSRTELKADFPIYLNQMYENRFPVKVSLTQKRGTSDYVLKIRRFNIRDILQTFRIPDADLLEPEHDIAQKILVTYPELSHSDLVTELEYVLEDAALLKRPDKAGPFLSDGFRRDDTTNVLEFYAHGEMIAAIEAQWYVIRTNKGKRSKETN